MTSDEAAAAGYECPHLGRSPSLSQRGRITFTMERSQYSLNRRQLPDLPAANWAREASGGPSTAYVSARSLRVASITSNAPRRRLLQTDRGSCDPAIQNRDRKKQPPIDSHPGGLSVSLTQRTSTLRACPQKQVACSKPFMRTRTQQ